MNEFITRVWVAVDRAETIRRGINGTATSVQIDLDVASMSPQDRDEIATRLSYDPEIVGREHVPGLRRLAADGSYCRSLMVVSDPTPAGVVAAMAEHRAAVVAVRLARAEHDRAAEAAEGAKREAWASYIADLEALYPDDWPEGCEVGCRDSLPEIGGRSYRSLGGRPPDDLRQRIDAIRLRQRRLASDRAAAEQSAWIAEHGSPRLRRLAAEGIDHRKTYAAEHGTWEAATLRERLAADRPGWQVVPAVGIDLAVADVSQRALALLDMARQVAPGARLAKLRTSGKYVAVEQYEGRWIYWPQD